MSEPLPGDLVDRVRPIASELADSLRRLVSALPGGPHRPSALARQVGMNRVTMSRLLNALRCSNPYEVLQALPGPESLRGFTLAARQFDVADVVVDDVDNAIEQFDVLIREQFGNRGALNAAISPADASLNRRVQENSRYHIYMGMRQVLGIEADTWLTCMVFDPSHDEQAEHIAVTTIHGPLGMRRLRSDIRVHFTFGPPFHASDEQPDRFTSPVSLQDLYVNEPASFETFLSDNGQLVHRLTHDAIGKDAVVDMLAVSHDLHGSRRYAAPSRPRGGVAVFPDVPVRMLHCDVLLPSDVFPDGNPELRVYSPGARGPANPNDPNRDIDLVKVPEQVELVSGGVSRFDVAEIPNYLTMVQRVCGQIGRPLDEFRMFRLRMAYPLHGFQYVMAFEAPPRPSSS